MYFCISFFCTSFLLTICFCCYYKTCTLLWASCSCMISRDVSYLYLTLLLTLSGFKHLHTLWYDLPHANKWHFRFISSRTLIEVNLGLWLVARFWIVHYDWEGGKIFILSSEVHSSCTSLDCVGCGSVIDWVVVGSALWIYQILWTLLCPQVSAIVVAADFIQVVVIHLWQFYESKRKDTLPASE